MNGVALYLYGLFAGLMPSTRGFRLRRFLLRLAGAEVGSGVRLVASARFLVGGQLLIGKETWIGHEVMVVGGDTSIMIGSSCDIAPRVTIVSGSHKVEPRGPRAAGAGVSLPITIGNGCWICTGAVVLGGTELGEHCVVAAGAVVHGRFPAYSLIGGVPARVIRPLGVETLPGVG